MKIVPLIKIITAFFPGTSGFLQIVNEAEAHSVGERLAALEDPLLQKYGDDAKPLFERIYTSVKAQTGRWNKVPWEESYEPYLKILNSLGANGWIAGAPAIGKSNQFERGFTLSPRLLIYLATFYGDGLLCERLSNLMESLEKGVTGENVRKEIPLPLSVIDAFFAAYEDDGQGIRSREMGGSGYYSPTH